MKMLLFFLSLAIAAAAALQAEMCFCEEAKHSEILKFQDEECHAELEAVEHIEITYYLYTDKPLPVDVPAIACSQWIRQKIVNRNLWGDDNFVLESINKDTSPEECATMNEDSRCGKHMMIPVGKGRRAFSSDPPESGAINAVTTLELLNCQVHNLNLSFPCAEYPLFTPVGPVDVSKGTITRGHLTVIWNKDAPRHAPCSKRKVMNLPSTFAYMTTDRTNTTRRIVDEKNPLDLHIEYNATRCSCDDCSVKFNTVLNNPDWYVSYKLIAETNLLKKLMPTSIGASASIGIS